MMVSTTLDGFYFANCVLAAVFFLFDYQYFRKYFENIFEKVCNFKKTLYICIVKQLKQSKMIDLNKITKEEFVNELILSNDVADFYNPREQELLSLDFDFEEMKEEFENWMIANCDNK